MKTEGDSEEFIGSTDLNLDSFKKSNHLNNNKNNNQVRDLRARESRTVALAGSLLIRKHRSSLSEPEAWAVAEQTAAAAIDCGAPLSAAPAVAAVRERFPDSRRADALAALFLEATRRLDDAAEICEAALEEAPAEAGALSARRAAMAWGRGDAAEALRLVSEHLDVYQSDGEAWAQAGDWYMASGVDLSVAASRAAFCYEEALLHAPTSAAAHARAGDAFFVAADATGPSASSSVPASSRAASREAARKHNGAAVALSGGAGCSRALWGLVACEAAAAGASSSSSSSSSSPSRGGAGGKERQQQASGGKSGGEAAENAAPLAAAALLKKYQEEAPDKVAMVRAALEGLGVKVEV